MDDLLYEFVAVGAGAETDVLHELVDEVAEVLFCDHAGEELEGTGADGYVVVGEAFEDEVSVDYDRGGVGFLEGDEADEAEVLEVLVELLDELLELRGAQSHDGGHGLGQRPVGLLGVRESESESEHGLVEERLGSSARHDRGERLEELTGQAGLCSRTSRTSRTTIQKK